MAKKVVTEVPQIDLAHDDLDYGEESVQESEQRDQMVMEDEYDEEQAEEDERED